MSTESRNTSNISKSSLSCARALLSKKKYGRSFANFLLFIKLCPHRQEDILDDFLHCMTEWTGQLIAEDRMDDLFKCYDQACEILPESESVLNNIGAQLFRLGYVEEAALYIRRSIQINPDFTPARQNLENVCSHLVERWHFRMLNDVRRNCAYKIAIRRAEQKGHQCVLDIGCGSGILSLFANKAGIPVIHACEKSKTMCQIAHDVFKANKAQAKINLICKASTELVIPEDIPERVSLVVTETFDAGLFGENIVSTLQHALQHLLLPLDDDENNEVEPTVIPCGATVYVCLIECEIIRNRNRFLYSGLQNVDLQGIPLYCTTGSNDDPYTTENLSKLQGSYKQLSDPVVLTKVNFTSIEELDILSSDIQWNTSVDLIKSGKLDALAVWFDLHLDEDVSISTDPSNKNCWEQAIFPVLPSNFCHSRRGAALQNNFQVCSGSRAHLCFSLLDNYLHLNSCLISDQGTDRCDVEMVENMISQQCPILLERTEIAKLNNLDVNRVFCQAIEKYLSKCENDTVSILDMCTELSPLTLQFLKQGISHATVVARKEIHDDIIRLAIHNDLDLDTLCIEDNVKSISGVHSVLICDLIEPCGAMRQQILEDIALLRVTSLCNGGVVMPGRVTIHGVGVESTDLKIDSAVISDEVTLGFTIGTFINDFQMTTHVDINLVELSHRKLTEPFELLSFNLNEEISEHHPPSFLKMQNKVKVVAQETGQLAGIVYWFEFDLYDGIHFTTLDAMSHWKQAAIMFKSSEEPILANQELVFNVTLENSGLNIKME